MKIELIEETTPGTGTMYVVRNNGLSVKWFSQREAAQAFYDSIIADPNVLIPTRNILQSQEINVPLD